MAEVGVINQVVTDRWSVINGDCIECVKNIPSESIHYSIFSPPFASLYTYSASDRDMGNCADDKEFHKHFRFLIPELLRITKPGRLLSFHCMNLPTSKARDGVIGLKDFRGDLIRSFCGGEAAEIDAVIRIMESRRNSAIEENDLERACDYEPLIKNLYREAERTSMRNGGWIYHSEVCIWKDPVTAMQRTKALGLLWKQIKKDSAMSRQGIPDYLVTMRKPGENPEPVGHTDESFPVDRWQQYASPVWASCGEDYTDGFKSFETPKKNDPDACGINPTETLQSMAEAEDERHICPLQLKVIERGVRLWTNPNDVVLSPFAGIGSEGYVSLANERKFIGIELKTAYYEQAVKNLGRAEKEIASSTLFDLASATPDDTEF